MKLREYKKEDAAIISKWLRTEDELYCWSADRFNKFPLFENDIDDNYSREISGGRFYPLTAIDDDKVIGHFIIRYPKENDDSTVRFGFVIVDPEIRRNGFGREMLEIGIRYVENNLDAKRIDLGVFEKNISARHCYEALGFREYNRRQCEMPIGIWNCIDMELDLEIKLIILDETYIPKIATLYKDAFSGEPWNDDWTDENQLMEYIKEISGGYRPLNYGLMSEGKLRAVCIGQIKHWWQGTEYYIDELFVEPDRQGQGLGSLLLEKIEKDIRSRGISGIFLQTESDKPAYGFYQRRDFKELIGHVSFFKKVVNSGSDHGNT